MYVLWLRGMDCLETIYKKAENNCDNYDYRTRAPVVPAQATLRVKEIFLTIPYRTSVSVPRDLRDKIVNKVRYMIDTMIKTLTI